VTTEVKVVEIEPEKKKEGWREKKFLLDEQGR
jgi:hypothetical protein